MHHRMQHTVHQRMQHTMHHRMQHTVHQRMQHTVQHRMQHTTQHTVQAHHTVQHTAQHTTQHTVQHTVQHARHAGRRAQDHTIFHGTASAAAPSDASPPWGARRRSAGVPLGEYPCLTWRTGGRARKRHSLDRLVPLFRRAPQAGGNQPGGKAQNSEIGRFPPAPRPLYIGSWTVKAQYPRMQG